MEIKNNSFKIQNERMYIVEKNSGTGKKWKNMTVFTVLSSFVLFRTTMHGHRRTWWLGLDPKEKKNCITVCELCVHLTPHSDSMNQNVLKHVGWSMSILKKRLLQHHNSLFINTEEHELHSKPPLGFETIHP